MFTAPFYTPYLCLLLFQWVSWKEPRERRDKSHFPPFNLWRRAGVIRAHFYPRKHHRWEAAKGNQRGKSSIFLHKPATGGRWLSSLHPLFSVTVAGKGSSRRQSQGYHLGSAPFITVAQRHKIEGHFSSAEIVLQMNWQKRCRFCNKIYG